MTPLAVLRKAIPQTIKPETCWGMRVLKQRQRQAIVVGVSPGALAALAKRDIGHCDSNPGWVRGRKGSRFGEVLASRFFCAKKAGQDPELFRPFDQKAAVRFRGMEHFPFQFWKAPAMICFSLAVRAEAFAKARAQAGTKQRKGGN